MDARLCLAQRRPRPAPIRTGTGQSAPGSRPTASLKGRPRLPELGTTMVGSGSLPDAGVLQLGVETIADVLLIGLFGLTVVMVIALLYFVVMSIRSDAHSPAGTVQPEEDAE